MSENPLPPQNESPEELKIKQRVDFFLGMFGSILVNLILYWLFKDTITWLPWVLNIIAIIVFVVLRRRSIAQGILASYGIGLAIVLCIGLATCFGEI